MAAVTTPERKVRSRRTRLRRIGDPSPRGGGSLAPAARGEPIARVERLAATADLEVEARARQRPAVAHAPDRRPPRDRVAHRNRDFGEMPRHTVVPAAVVEDHEPAVAL